MASSSLLPKVLEPDDLVVEVHVAAHSSLSGQCEVRMSDPDDRHVRDDALLGFGEEREAFRAVELDRGPADDRVDRLVRVAAVVEKRGAHVRDQ